MGRMRVAKRDRFVSLPVLSNELVPAYLLGGLPSSLFVGDDAEDMFAEKYTHRFDSTVTCARMYRLASQDGRWETVSIGGGFVLKPTGIYKATLHDDGDSRASAHTTYHRRVGPDEPFIAGARKVHPTFSMIGLRLDVKDRLAREKESRPLTASKSTSARSRRPE
ncbi:hypothetical protein [Actinomycetospora flava]|uniref:Polyketide cyclase/dehydrase/lipid transport protein n=1 Tax=Actinomycetospora flava TaxID=3129232 RepID=A0ABU8MHI9_9PSEU